MFENPRRGRQARNFTTNAPKILELKSSSEQIFSENWRWVPLKSLRPLLQRFWQAINRFKEKAICFSLNLLKTSRDKIAISCILNQLFPSLKICKLSQERKVRKWFSLFEKTEKTNLYRLDGDSSRWKERGIEEVRLLRYVHVCTQ